MQDLISDGQCPFSPQGPPPHGFPHFLFAAAQQAAQQNGLPNQLTVAVEDSASALLRERTIMALDSFLQQQQHQQQQIQHHQHLERDSSSGSPRTSQVSNPGAPNGSLDALTAPGQQRRSPTSQPNAALPMMPGSFPGQLPYPANYAQVPISQANGQAANLEQLILQQQQQHQFAAAMAAAMSSGAHQHPLHSLFSQSAPSFQSGGKSGELPSPSSPVTSSASLELQQQQQYLSAGQQRPPSYHSAPLGGAPSHHFPHHYSPHILQQVMMAAARQHHHQVAAMSAVKKLDQQQLSGAGQELGGESKLAMEQVAANQQQREQQQQQLAGGIKKTL